MTTFVETRYATSSKAFKKYDTSELRNEFLISNLTQNHEAIIFPPRSIHCGSGTSNYTFICGKASENLDYGDMDVAKITNLK